MKIFVINGGQRFSDSIGGSLNASIASLSTEMLRGLGHEVRETDINDEIDPALEVEKYLWADAVLYTMPIWWFHMPHRLKWYLDTVLMAGVERIWLNDGRTRGAASRKYGSGGLSQGKRYMVITSWNAPEEAFTDPAQFFGGRSVDEGVLFAFHRMKAFLGYEAPLESFHFYDVHKSDEAIGQRLTELRAHLTQQFASR